MSDLSYWFEKKTDVHKAVIDTGNSIYRSQRTLYSDWENYASLWKDRRVSSFEPGQWKRATGQQRTRTSYNIIRACTNTATSRITRDMPQIKLFTSGAKDVIQQQAKAAEEFIWSAIDHTGGHKQGRLGYRDATLYGPGIWKGYAEDGEVKLRRVHPSRIVVDDQAALEGRPLSWWQREYVDPFWLAGKFPQFKDQIMEARGVRILPESGGEHARQLVEVWEAFREPVGGQKGRHVIAIRGETLLDEEWSERAPYEALKWMEDLLGWHGVGIGEELEALQLTINDLIAKIMINMDLLAVPYLLKPKGANIADNALGSNLVARIIEYTGNVAPRIETPPAVHPQVLQWLEQLYHRGFEIMGISEMSATSKRDTGSLRSGLAVNLVQDVETIRFAQQERDWLELWPLLAKLMLRTGRRVKGWTVKARSREKIRELKAADLHLDENYFEIGLYTASSLPKQPSARASKIVEYVQSQMMTPQEGRQLLELPDLDKWAKLADSEFDLFEQTFEAMLDGDDYIEPVEFQDLSLGMQLAKRYYAKSRLDKIDDRNVQKVVRWMSDAAAIMTPPAPPMAPGGGDIQPGAAPPAPQPPQNPMAAPA